MKKTTKKKSVKPSKKPNVIKPACCSCEEPAVARGLCWNHYMQARYKVLKGKTTWKKLENKGAARKKGTK